METCYGQEARRLRLRRLWYGLHQLCEYYPRQGEVIGIDSYYGNNTIIIDMRHNQNRDFLFSMALDKVDMEGLSIDGLKDYKVLAF